MNASIQRARAALAAGLLGALSGCASSVVGRGDGGADAQGGDVALDSSPEAALPDASDARVDAVTDASPAIPAPRLVAPLSTATVTSRRPTFHWALGPGSDGARVQVCRDRACNTVVTTLTGAGNTATPMMDLPSDVLFWRTVGRAGDVDGVATSATWEFTVGARTATGPDTSWGTTLDVNGDGFADLAVGAYGAMGYVGRVHVYLGSNAGLATRPATSLTGLDGADMSFGRAVASAGDVNGDGFADLVVGDDNADRVYVYLGGAAGLATTPATSLTGPDGAGGHFGVSVASAGDVNGDGYADLAVGANAALGGTGRAHVYLGSAMGLATTPASSFTGGSVGVPTFGASVASAGDVNGDGYADLAIAAPAGIWVYVYLGSATGLSATPASSFWGYDVGRGGLFGWSVSSAGDVNGDGYADLVVGNYSSNDPLGRAHVFLGSAAGLAEFPNTVVTGTDGPDEGFGYWVTGVGDVNRDGFADVAVGSYIPSYVTMDMVTRTHLYLGSAMGLVSTPSASLTSPSRYSQFYSFSVVSAGDVNRDGYADLAVGASEAGRVDVYLGRASGLSPTPARSLTGPDEDNSGFGASVATAWNPLASPRRRVYRFHQS